MLWRCECGCRGIAADLPFCPMCGKERDMPKATSGGASNAWEQPDGDVFEMSAAWEAEAPPAPEEAPAEPAVEEPAAADPVTVEEPASVEDVAAPKASARTRKV